MGQNAKVAVLDDHVYLFLSVEFLERFEARHFADWLLERPEIFNDTLGGNWGYYSYDEDPDGNTLAEEVKLSGYRVCRVEIEDYEDEIKAVKALATLINQIDFDAVLDDSKLEEGKIHFIL